MLSRICRPGWAILIPTIALACSPPTPAALSPADADAIRAASAAYVQSASDTAWTQWAGLFTEDAIFLPPNTAARVGRAAVEAWGRSFPPIKDLRIEPLEVEGVADLAYVRGRYSLLVTLPGVAAVPDTGKYIEIWRKQGDGAWKLSRDIYNSDRAAPAAPPPGG